MNFPFCLLRIDIIDYSCVFFNASLLHFKFKLTVDKIFDKNYSLFSFKHDYDPDEFDKREREKLRQKEQERKQQYSYDYYYDDEEELEKDNDDGMEI